MSGPLTVVFITNTFAFFGRVVTSVAIKLAAGKGFFRKEQVLSGSYAVVERSFQECKLTKSSNVLQI